MRVRIRRFRSDAGLLPVVKSAPLLMHVGNSLFMEPAVGQGPLDDAVTAHPPVPFPAARGHANLLARDAQRQEMAAGDRCR